jgi:hypothetical protein
MRWPDPRNDNARGQAGEVGKAQHISTANSSAHLNEVKKDDIPGVIARHFCLCRGTTICIFCLAWNRRIRNHEVRRTAPSLLYRVVA